MIENQNQVEGALNCLNEIIKKTAGFTGTEFFRSLVWQLCVILEVRCAVICEVVVPESERVRTLAIWEDGKFHDNFEYALVGTLWENSARNKNCFCSENVKNTFPEYGFLSEIDSEGCLGVPLFDSVGKLLGILAILHHEKLPNPSHIASILDVAAIRTAAEIKRIQKEERLRQNKQEAEIANRMKTELLERISHDLRSPMNVILGYAKLLESDPNNPLSEAQQDRVQWICKGADRLMEIITEISDLREEEPLSTFADRPKVEPKNVIREKSESPSEILYIEDNLANLRLMEKLMKRRSGTRLVTTPASKRGLDLAFSQHFALILLDINLPGMDGYEVLKQLQNRSETKDIPVIAVSADAMPKHIEKAMAAGFYDYVTKPFEFSYLNEVIDRALEVIRE